VDTNDNPDASGGHSYCDRNGHLDADTHADPYGNSYSDTNQNAITHAHPDLVTHRYEDTEANGDGKRYPDTDAHADAYDGTHGDAQPNPHTRSNPDGHRHADADLPSQHTPRATQRLGGRGPFGNGVGAVVATCSRGTTVPHRMGRRVRGRGSFPSRVG
jgi:hypothetical protein